MHENKPYAVCNYIHITIAFNIFYNRMALVRALWTFKEEGGVVTMMHVVYLTLSPL